MSTWTSVSSGISLPQRWDGKRDWLAYSPLSPGLGNQDVYHFVGLEENVNCFYTNNSDNAEGTGETLYQKFNVLCCCNAKMGFKSRLQCWVFWNQGELLVKCMFKATISSLIMDSFDVIPIDLALMPCSILVRPTHRTSCPVPVVTNSLHHSLSLPSANQTRALTAATHLTREEAVLQPCSWMSLVSVDDGALASKTVCATDNTHTMPSPLRPIRAVKKSLHCSTTSLKKTQAWVLFP